MNLTKETSEQPNLNNPAIMLDFGQALEELKKGNKMENQTEKVVEQKSLGELRVKVDFNVTNDKLVDYIKQETAKLINILEQERTINSTGEKHRLISLAQTDYEKAAMWAVKSIFS